MSVQHLYRVSAPWFVAGLVVHELPSGWRTIFQAAPILYKFKSWSLDNFNTLARKRGWVVDFVETLDRCSQCGRPLAGHDLQMADSLNAPRGACVACMNAWLDETHGG